MDGSRGNGGASGGAPQKNEPSQALSCESVLEGHGRIKRRRRSLYTPEPSPNPDALHSNNIRSFNTPPPPSRARRGDRRRCRTRVWRLIEVVQIPEAVPAAQGSLQSGTGSGCPGLSNALSPAFVAEVLSPQGPSVALSRTSCPIAQQPEARPWPHSEAQRWWDCWQPTPLRGSR